MKPSYAGKIGNKSSQEVEPLFQQKKGKAPTVKKGGDLRAKGGKK